MEVSDDDDEITLVLGGCELDLAHKCSIPVSIPLLYIVDAACPSRVGRISEIPVYGGGASATYDLFTRLRSLSVQAI